MTNRILGKVIDIAYSAHSESKWQLDVSGVCSDFYCTDLADTSNDYAKYLNREIIFESNLQIANLKIADGQDAEQISFPNSSCYAEFVGTVIEILDADEVMIRIGRYDFTVESEQECCFKVGDLIKGNGEMRIDISSIRYQNS